MDQIRHKKRHAKKARKPRKHTPLLNPPGVRVDSKAHEFMQHWRKRELNTEVYYELSLRECYITLEPRVHYCDRGNWWAKVTCAGHPTNPNPLDAQDGWPRFYMSLERAKIEIVEWAIKRRYHTIINKTKQ